MLRGSPRLLISLRLLHLQLASPWYRVPLSLSLVVPFGHLGRRPAREGNFVGVNGSSGEAMTNQREEST